MGLEGKFLCAECFDALPKLRIGKASLNDGLTVEFFKGFGTLLSQQLTDS